MATEAPITLKEMIDYVDNFAGFAGNFAGGVIESLSGAQRNAASFVAVYQREYSAAIAMAIAARDAAGATGDVRLQAAITSYADDLSRMALALADNTKTAAERLANHDRLLSARGIALGAHAGLAFDTYKLFDAVISGNGQATAEAALGIALGWAGGTGASYLLLTRGIAAAIGIGSGGTAVLVGLASGVAAFFAKEIYKYSGMQWLAERIALGEGAAQLDPKNVSRLLVLFSKLNPSISPSVVDGLLDIAGNSRQEKETVALTNHMARLLAPSAPQLSASASEPQLLSLLEAIASATEAATGSLQFSSNTPSVSDAKSNYAAFLSLHLHVPVMVRGGAELDALLTVAHGQDLYSMWQADAALRAQAGANSPADADLNFSDRYLQDSAALLEYLVKKNKSEWSSEAVRTTSYGGNAYWYEYRDASGIQQRINVVDQGVSGSIGDDSRIRVTFGNDQGNFLAGGRLNDRLYGNGGMDQINAGEGNDHLEGGAAFDSLYGEKGNDTLHGGTGGDWLEGGEGNDLQFGGAGIDTYRFATGWGQDTIEDSDGLGVISIEGLGNITGAGAKKVGDHVWQTDDKRVNYTLVEADGTRKDLYITFSDRTDTICIRDWSPRNLGIELPETEEELPPEEPTLIGDQAKFVSGTHYVLDGDGYRTEGMEADAKDILIGTNEDDIISGLGGNDGLVGGEGADELQGGAGNDLIFGGTGADTIEGGEGSDFIFGSAVGQINRPSQTDFVMPSIPSDEEEITRGFSWIAARSETPRYDSATSTYTMRYVGIYGADQRPLFTGPGGHLYVEGDGNVIDGGEGDDYIAAGTGDDTVNGGGDDDDIVGMRGDDILFGDEGDDYIWGDSDHDPDGIENQAESTDGYDLLVGGAGNDVLVGQGADDELYGGDGNDHLNGDENDEATSSDYHGNDYLDGGDGNDDMSGGGRDDVLVGGFGNDSLWGDGSSDEEVTETHHGSDELLGEEGDDQIHGGGNDDFIEGGADNDSLWGDDDGQDTIEAAIHGEDYLDGGDGDDHLEGGGNNDALFGGDGDDSIAGDGGLDRASSIRGDDLLDGEAGDDDLFGEAGNDTLYGGAGNDSLRGDFGDEEGVSGGLEGDDELDGEEGDDGLVGNGGNDTLLGGEGNDTLLGDGAQGGNEIESDGDDLLNGGDGNDAMFGQGGDDTVTGGTGDDSLAGGSGQDELAGDEGQDTLFGQADEDYLDGGDGNDYLDGGQGFDELIGAGGADTLYGAGDGDVLDGGADNDYLDGGSGSDALIGGDGADYLLGQAGNDNLLGSEGNDQLLGGSGDDILMGGAGADYMAGGEGNDTYVVSSGDMLVSGGYVDTIADIEGENTLVLDVDFDDVELLSASQPEDLAIRVGEGRELIIQDGLLGAISTIQFADGSSMTIDRLIGELWSTPVNMSSPTGRPFVYGGSSADILYGGNYNFSGLGGNAVLSGGRGNDQISYGSGYGGTILFSPGDGLDTLMPGATQVAFGVDKLQLGAGLSFTDVQIYSLGSQRYRLQLGSASDGIVFTVPHPSLLSVYFPLDQVVFSDGQTVAWQQVVDKGVIHDFTAMGGAAFYATWHRDIVLGNGVSRTISTDQGDDEIRAGSGAEVMIGGRGDDRYVFSAGFGRDVVDNSDAVTTEADVISFDASLPVANATFIRLGDDLFVSFSGGQGTLQVTSFFNGTGSSTIEFANGPSFTRTSPPTYTTSLQALATDGNDSFNLPAGDNHFDALLGNDTIMGGTGNDTIIGGAGADSLSGGAGNDNLIDGEYVRGGAGNDTYTLTQLQSLTVGAETNRASGFDTIQLPTGVTAADLVVSRGVNQSTGQLDDLYLDIRGTSYRIVVDQFFSAPGAENEIESIRFADGSNWTISDIFARVPNVAGTAGNDTLIGFRWNDILNGGSGDDAVSGWDGSDLLSGGAGRDTLNGGVGADTLEGGQGVDQLAGGTGADVYRFDSSSGHDLVTEIGAPTREIDAIDLGSGITPADVTLVRDERDLVLILSNSATQLRIRNHFVASQEIYNYQNGQFQTLPTDYAIEQIRFASGSIWNESDILARTVVGTVNTQTGTSGNDVYAIDHVNDVINPGPGGGVDTAVSTVSYALSEGVANLTLTGAVGAELRGNSQANVLTGNLADNIFNNRTHWGSGDFSPIMGADTLVGGAGDDTYHVNGTQINASSYYNPNTDDTVVENAGEGIDTIISSTFNGQVQDNVERYIDTYGYGTWTSTNVNGTTILGRTLTGNDLNNEIRVTGGGSGIGDVASSMGRDWVGSVIRIDGGLGADTMEGSHDDTTYVVDNAGDVVIEASTFSTADTVESSVSYTLGSNLENLLLTGDAVIQGVGNGLNNRLDGSANSAANVLRGGAGDDTYVLGSGDSFIENANEGFDTLVLTAGQSGGVYRISDYANIEALTLDFTIPSGTTSMPTLIGSNGNDTLTNLATQWDSDGTRGGLVQGGGGDDTLGGGDGRDTLDGGIGADEMRGGLGNDTYRVDNVNDRVFESSRPFWYSPDPGTDTIETSIDLALPANVEVLVAVGGTGIRLTGNATGNELDGSRNLGIDTLTGGEGDDFYTVDANDVVVETADGGAYDRTFGVGSFTMADNVEIGQLVDGALGNIVGNASSNFIMGSASANELSGHSGNDTLQGLDGNDSIDGGSGDDLIYGDLGNDSLRGGSGNDIYEFGRGQGRDRIDNRDTVDAMDSLRLNDVTEAELVVTRTGDDLVLGIRNTTDQLTVAGYFSTSTEGGQSYDGKLEAIEFLSTGVVWNQAQIDAAVVVNRAPILATPLADQAAAQGAVFSWAVPANAFSDPDAGDSLTYSATLANGTALPSWLAFNPTTRAFSGTPTSVGIIDVRVIVTDGGGLSASDVFSLNVTIQNLVRTGTSGADTLTGAAGNDTLSGLAGNDRLVGDTGNDSLDGGTGNDTMLGGAGNDIYFVDATADVVTELAGEGTDTVQTTITLTLAANVENLTLTGTNTISGTGNSLSNVLTGNSGSNRLDGAAGADTMVGGAGNDIYVVDVAGDVVTELASGGTDTIESSLSWALGAEIENLTLTGSSALNGTGNSLVNTLTGNSGANTLDGGAGADSLVGGAGNDTYIVDNTGDVVTEGASAGTDLVQSSVNYTLATNVENLTLTGTSALNGTGNTLNNVLTGNAGNNTLNGGTGTDTLIGGAGDDTYVVDATTDMVTEAAGEGTDLVQSTVTYTLAANVENLTLTSTGTINGTGNTLNNVLTGNSANNNLSGGAGNDTLDGGTGNDTMVGGVGDDTFIVNVSTDVVTEAANEGTDTIRSAVTLTLGSNVENLTLIGTSTINGTGNTLNNVLIGNGANNSLSGGAGNDTLDGGLGNDTLVGGAGNDTFVVNVSTDVITENASEGTDTVQSSVTWTLSTNLENLTLIGTSAINGTGNASANVLTGNAQANTLSGLGGADTLDGGAGNDILDGGAAADTYLFGRGWGTDTVRDNDSTANVKDRIQLGSGIVQGDMRYSRVGNNLEALIFGTTDKVVVQDWYLGNQYHVEEFRFADGSILTDSQVQGLVGAMATFSAAPAAETSSGRTANRGTPVVDLLAPSML